MGRLISTSDMTIRYMTAGVESSRFDPFIVEAEELDIRPFLGDALFLAMVDGLASSPQTAIYTDLLNGKDYAYGNYTVEFKGLKWAIQYFAYARYLANHSVVNTKVGQREKTDEFSQQPSERATQRRIDQSRSAAQSFLMDAEKFLNELSTTYTLWGATQGKVKRKPFRVIGG